MLKREPSKTDAELRSNMTRLRKAFYEYNEVSMAPLRDETRSDAIRAILTKPLSDELLRRAEEFPDSMALEKYVSADLARVVVSTTMSDVSTMGLAAMGLSGAGEGEKEVD